MKMTNEQAFEMTNEQIERFLSLLQVLVNSSGTMTNEQIERFLSLLQVLVNSSGTWQEKKARLEDLAAKDDLDNIEEFVAWFDQAE